MKYNEIHEYDYDYIFNFDWYDCICNLQCVHIK
jgi:hypothetical protein